MAKRNKNKLLPFIMMFALLSFGIFIGALIASPSYREGIFAQVNQSKPIRYVNDYLREKEFDLALELPTGKDHPALRRRQNR